VLCISLDYSIVSLMRRRSDSGISVPSAFAALRLTMSSTLHWQVGGLVAFEKTARKDAGLAIRVGHARSVAHETASGYIFAIIIDCRQRTMRGQSKQYARYRRTDRS
jgi:hypothetical protein